MRVLFLLLVLALLSCRATKDNSTAKTLKFNSSFGSFSIDAPNGWIKVPIQGIDAYVGRIAVDARDTLDFDLGYYSSDLTEQEPEDFDGDDYSKYAKTKVSYDTINGYRAKLVTPKKYGVGMSGVYIDSLWMDGVGKIKFNFHGNNLKKMNQQRFFQTLKTLKFEKTN